MKFQNCLTAFISTWHDSALCLQGTRDPWVSIEPPSYSKHLRTTNCATRRAMVGSLAHWGTSEKVQAGVSWASMRSTGFSHEPPITQFLRKNGRVPEMPDLTLGSCGGVIRCYTHRANTKHVSDQGRSRDAT